MFWEAEKSPRACWALVECEEASQIESEEKDLGKDLDSVMRER